MEPIPAGLPDPADIRRRVARGRSLTIPIDKGVPMSAVSAAAAALQRELPRDMLVNPSSLGPVLHVLQLISDAEAEALRPALDNLLAEYRHAAGALIALMRAAAGPEEEEYPETVDWRDTTWHVHEHGDDCRFYDPDSGETVEAAIWSRDKIDPSFLLLYAETSGRHQPVVDACVHGFSDMCRLLDLAGVTSA